MKKKKVYRMIAFVLICCVPVLFAGCASGGRRDGQVSFSATVVEVNGTELIVCPDEGSDELRSADRISVSTKTAMNGEAGFSVGDRVNITYNGDIMETYPAQLGGVSGVTHIG